MKKFYFVCFVLALTCYASSLYAKMWLLPDYQGKKFFPKRNNDPRDDMAAGKDKGAFKCGNYAGMIALSDLSSDYKCTNSYSAPQGCCKEWVCKEDRFPETESSCRSAGKIADETTACTGSSGARRYRSCKCDTSTYPHTSSACIAELSGTSCEDNYGTHYEKCITDWCDNPEYVDMDCGEYRCKETYDKCDSKCEVCYADTCDYPENASYPLKGECDYGCDTQGTIDGCEKRCKNCRSCTITDCASMGYTQSCPANSICNDTCVPNSCEGTVYYKATACETNYYSPKTHWCNVTYCQQ